MVTCFPRCASAESQTSNFRVRRGREQRNKVQKRGFREKLALDTLSGHKRRQPELPQRNIGACRIVPKVGDLVKNELRS